MKILISPYSFANPQLESGVLLKVIWGVNDVGYSDLICHPRLGDLELQTHLKSLIESRPTELVKRAIGFAVIDAKGRRLGRNLLYGLALPRSHKRIRTLEEAGEANQQGFTHIKIKMGKNLEGDKKLLEDVQLSCPELKVRIDFNGQLSFQKFSDWWTSLSANVKSQIDFIEDAFSDQTRSARDLNAPLAWDWLKDPTEKMALNKDIRVIKPSHQSIEGLEQAQRVIFTHSMGHWLGQAAALWTAARYYQKFPQKMEVCGLLPTPFLEEWPKRGPHLVPPKGTGFGLDDLLQSQKWERLV